MIIPTFETSRVIFHKIMISSNSFIILLQIKSCAVARKIFRGARGLNVQDTFLLQKTQGCILGVDLQTVVPPHPIMPLD